MLTTDRTYEYDHHGSRTLRDDKNVVTQYSYDRTDQLISLTSGTTPNFAYDRYGNQATKALAAADRRTMADAGVDVQRVMSERQSPVSSCVCFRCPAEDRSHTEHSITHAQLGIERWVCF